MANATFAAGCFWCVEPVFRQLKGVSDVQVGYIGGHTDNPSYEAVCSKTTGHAEAVEVTYNADEISYEALLEVFWMSHDPTTLNRQGPDIGTQYRSAIFYHSLEQKHAAEASKKLLQESKRFFNPIVTEIVAATTFYRAEEYHQQYHAKHGIL